MENKKRCACCGQWTLPEDSCYEICRVCGWEDDDVQNDDPQFSGGANDMSLEEARAAYAQGLPVK